MNVAFAGRAGSGKDTAAEYLIQKYGYRKVSFAQPIKDIMCQLFPDWPERDPRCREFLQKFGTDLCRAMDPDVWVRQFEKTVAEKHCIGLNSHCLSFAAFGSDACKDCGKKRPLVCTDVRFSNEAEWLLAHGWLVIALWVPDEVRIERLKERDGMGFDESRLTHSSEEAIDQVNRHVTILSRGPKEQMWAAVECAMKNHGWKAA